MNEFFQVHARGAALFQLPVPYPDELLYSVIARAAYRNAHWSPKGLMAAVFGDPKVLACPDLPGRLELLCGSARILAAGRRLSLRDIALRYTLVGYYTHYLGGTERDRMLAFMAGKAAHLHLRLGICAGVVNAPKAFRLCPICMNLDLRQMGETYWRRSHQLPGVLVCPEHASPLWQTCVPMRPIGRHEHVYAHGRFLLSGQPMLEAHGSVHEELLALAVAATRLLDAPVTEQGPLHDYREGFRSRGFHGRRGAERIWQALLDLYGLDVMRLLARGGDAAHPPAWIEEVLRRPRRALHPLKHLLVERLLQVHAPQVAEEQAASVKTWGIYKVADLREQAQRLAQSGLTVNGVANRLGLDWKTADRLLQPLPIEKPSVIAPLIQADRATWLSLVQQSPGSGRAQWRRQEPALYGRMYRRDREWLMQHGERLPRRAAQSRVAWRERDEALAQSVQDRAQAIRCQEPMHRVSASYVLGTLGARTVVGRYGNKLPLTRAALLGGCEGVEDFQMRRLVARGGAEGLRAQPVWRLMRTANLNPERFPDKGAGIVARARRVSETRRWPGSEPNE